MNSEAMSCSPEFAELAGQKAPAPSKSTFSQTCNLLSQYLKEKGSLGDLKLGRTSGLDGNGIPAPEMLRPTGTTAAATMNLFPFVEKSADGSSPSMAAPRNLKSINLFPQQAGFTADASATKSAAKEPETAPMTIFYAGQVFVFNDFPSDKARELMLFAAQASSQSQSQSRGQGQATPFASNVGNIQACSGALPPSTGSFPAFANQLPPQAMMCDLPIARKASLHRFLEKRKDRINARSPYQAGSPGVGPCKPAESKSWLGLAAAQSQ